METLAYAADAAQQGGGSQNMISMLFPFVLIFGVMYLLLIRPQQKKQKKHQEMLKSLKKGDKVITSGGLYGIIVKVTERDVILEVADKVNLRYSVSAIGHVRERDGGGESD